jgi:hypothetical protein
VPDYRAGVFGRRRRGHDDPPAGAVDAGAAAREQLQRVAVSGDARAVEAELAAILRDDPAFDLVRTSWGLAAIADAITGGVVWAEPARYRGAVDGTFWADAEREVAQERASGWRVEITPRTQTTFSVHELSGGNLTVQVQSTYARRVFDGRGTQIDGDDAPRLHTSRIGGMRFVEARTPDAGGLATGCCPSCGSPLLVTAERTCSTCGVALPDPYRDWVAMWCYAID